MMERDFSEPTVGGGATKEGGGERDGKEEEEGDEVSGTIEREREKAEEKDSNSSSMSSSRKTHFADVARSERSRPSALWNSSMMKITSLSRFHRKHDPSSSQIVKQNPQPQPPDVPVEIPYRKQNSLPSSSSSSSSVSTSSSATCSAASLSANKAPPTLALPVPLPNTPLFVSSPRSLRSPTSPSSSSPRCITSEDLEKLPLKLRERICGGNPMWREAELNAELSQAFSSQLEVHDLFTFSIIYGVLFLFIFL